MTSLPLLINSLPSLSVQRYDKPSLYEAVSVTGVKAHTGFATEGTIVISVGIVITVTL